MRGFIRAFVAAAVMLACPAVFASDVSTWSNSASGNSYTVPNGFPENMLPSGVNDSAREMMAALKRWYERFNAVQIAAGTPNALTLTYSVSPGTYRIGDGYTFIAGSTNTGAATININGIGAKSIKLGTSDLTGGEITAGRAVMVFYDGTNFQLLSGGAGTTVVAGNCLLAIGTTTDCLLVTGSTTDALLVQ